ncbi:hypothetical protein LSTR_LSTR000162 [Laodelphax striatellus]|uniref:Uncharacterized protein n=1 Tax=Laodelphax striatellus TaxID=195883 RepID=A0A482X7K9_LAOST|nr:hypothetical protein LSTR_LSTR000162 [Laodelphax striatellus]
MMPQLMITHVRVTLSMHQQSKFGNVLAYNSFAYIKKMINTYLYKNSYEVANLCTGNNTLDDAYVRIIYFAGKRTRYYALWELGALFNDKLPPVADALPRVYLMRSEVDLCGVRTEFWSLHNYTTIEDHYEIIEGNEGGLRRMEIVEIEEVATDGSSESSVE